MSHLRGLACAGLLLAAAAPAAAQPRTEAGVRLAENAWSEAFVTGDTAALGALLDANYLAVNTRGVARPKAEIVREAVAYAAQHPGQHARPFPASSTIAVIGAAAVVRHRSSGDVSVDVLHYAGGHWRAWYSQHTSFVADASARAQAVTPSRHLGEPG